MAAWKLILQSGGLKRIKRRHVHFAVGLPEPPKATPRSRKVGSEPTAEPADSPVAAAEDDNGTEQAQKVISGMRKTATVMIWVDVKKSVQEGGLKWWKSANGVVLTEGDAEEKVGLEWVLRVERRGTGEVIWEPGKAGNKGEES